MADYLPSVEDEVTVIAAGAITGGLMVTTGGVVAGANAVDWLGVASRDVISGQPVTVFLDQVQLPQAAGAIAQGALVKCAAAGQLTTFVDGTDATGRLVGIALEAASGAGVQFKCKFIR